MSRFDDEKYLQNFHEAGIYPAIHDRLFDFIEDHSSGGILADLGCCYGLLAHRLVHAGSFSGAVCVDPNKAYIKSAVKSPALKYVNGAINKVTLDEVIELFSVSNVRTVIARRVIPEISDGEGVGFIAEFAARLASIGVNDIFIEGRIVSSKSKHPLFSMQREIEALNVSYKWVAEENNCAWLTRRSRG
jgi:hypothetical protein